MPKLESEIKQRKPFESLHEEAALNIVRTAADLEHRMAQDLKPFGITVTQYNVLRILRGAGAEGLCRHEVGSRLVRAVPDVTRLLDRMEDSGLIERQRGDRDRRYVTTRLTTKGLNLVNQLDHTILAINEKRLGHLDRNQLTKVIELMTEIRST